MSLTSYQASGMSSADGISSGADIADEQQVLFRLFDGLALGPCPPHLLITHKGAQYLCVTPLQPASLSSNNEEEEEEE